MEPYSSSLMATHGDLAAGVVTKPQARERRRTPRHRRSTASLALHRGDCAGRIRWRLKLHHAASGTFASGPRVGDSPATA